VTTVLAEDDLVATGSGLGCGIDRCAQPVKHPMISHVASGDFMVASRVV
jgi:hypothetical protein